MRPGGRARIALMGLGLVGLVWLEQARPAAGPPLEWRSDLDVALAEAGVAARPVLVSFHASWCAACRELDRQTLRDPEVARTLESFERVRVDLSHSDSRTRNRMRRFRIVGLPALVQIDAEGQRAGSLVGFVGRTQLLDWLQPLASRAERRAR